MTAFLLRSEMFQFKICREPYIEDYFIFRSNAWRTQSLLNFIPASSFKGTGIPGTPWNRPITRTCLYFGYDDADEYQDEPSGRVPTGIEYAIS